MTGGRLTWWRRRLKASVCGFAYTYVPKEVEAIIVTHPPEQVRFTALMPPFWTP